VPIQRRLRPSVRIALCAARPRPRSNAVLQVASVRPVPHLVRGHVRPPRRAVRALMPAVRARRAVTDSYVERGG